MAIDCGMFFFSFLQDTKQYLLLDQSVFLITYEIYYTFKTHKFKLDV